MAKELTSSSAPISDLTRYRLRDIRRALLHLHKALLETERVSFERARGRIRGSGEFLQLVTRDPWFSWLHPLSGLIVQIDELLDAEEPAAECDAGSLADQARTLLKPSEDGAGFERKYYDALQNGPDVVLAHAGASRLLAREI